MTIIITGGSSGIGKATAMLFAQRGCAVYELSRHGVSHDGIRHIDCDVTSPQSCEEALQQVMSEQQTLDVLISNAGMGISGPIEFTAEEDARRIFDVNFFGAMHIVRAALPWMRRQRSGRILFVSSVAAIFSIPYQSYYSATKAALNAMALALRNEVKEWGIEVACLMPGDVRTGFTEARHKEVAGRDVYPRAAKAVETMEHDEQHGMSPEKIACQLWQMAHSRHVGIYNVAGWSYRLLCLMDRLVPKSWSNWVVGKMYGG